MEDTLDDNIENGEEEKGEAAVAMSQDFGGDVTDLSEAEAENDKGREQAFTSGFQSRCITTDEETADENEMGKLEKQDAEHIDRNMWAPQENQQGNEVSMTS